jgi:hypothetical protein
VLVDVEDLTLDERKQILYNHLAGGDQPVKVKSAMKPFLDHAAAAGPFRPEMARRLGLRAFTAGLATTKSGIAEFMTHPRQFLRDVYEPLGQPGWAFRHPTLWEGFAAWVSTQPHLLTVVLAGITDSELLTKVDCGDENAGGEHGTLLRVPAALYRAVAERLAAIRQQPYTGRLFRREGSLWRRSETYEEYRDTQDAVLSFLCRRSSDAFLRAYLDIDPELPGSLVNFTSFVSAVPEPAVLARLRRAGLLDEQVRLQAVDRMAYLAVKTPDDGWLRTQNWKILLTPADRARLMDKVRTDLIPRLETLDGIGHGERDPDDDPYESALLGYQLEFEKDGDFEAAEAFDLAREFYSQLPAKDRDYGEYQEDPRPLARPGLAPPPGTDRSIFDDIDE